MSNNINTSDLFFVAINERQLKKNFIYKIFIISEPKKATILMKLAKILWNSKNKLKTQYFSLKKLKKQKYGRK